MDSDGGSKGFIEMVPIKFCQNVIVDNELDDVLGRENPDSSDFTHYNRPSVTRFRLEKVYIDIKIPNNTKILHPLQ